MKNLSLFHILCYNQRVLKTNGNDGAPIEIEGDVLKVVFHNERNGWAVVRMSCGKIKCTATGTMLEVKEGERLRLTGQWIMDRQWGRQFKVTLCQSIKPTTAAGMEKYLASGLFNGVGPSLAKRIVHHFGDDVMKILEEKPRALLKVPGIGKKLFEQFMTSWKVNRETRELMVFLQGFGISANFAAKIRDKYGFRAMELVQRNPYRLAEDIRGIGFSSADKIAQRMGIAHDDPQRFEAAVLHCLEKSMGEGHVFLPRELLCSDAAALLQTEDIDSLDNAVDRLEKRNAVILENLDEGQAVYIREMHRAEEEAARRLGDIASTEGRELNIPVSSALAWAEKKQGIKFEKTQKQAIASVFTSKLTVITGGPGTGKTTLLKAVTGILRTKGCSVALCAPTGRAAVRAEETTGHSAGTIHRLLKFNPALRKFEHNEDDPIFADVFIVDESSMLDIMLLRHLLRAIPPKSRLVLVGDVDQLPSVGPGTVLRDLIASDTAEVIRLNVIFRQASQSLIISNAHRVNHGQPLESSNTPESDFFFIDRNDSGAALDTVLELVSERVPKKLNCDPIEDIQVITPMHRGNLGTENLNYRMRQLLNPQGTELKSGIRSFRHGDKVMQTSNDYERGVFNGEIGRVRAVDLQSKCLTVNFGGRVQATYGVKDLDELSLAYACSIHKSQGSEFPAVIVVMHGQHFIMLQRNLLYTAITRGRKLVLIVGTNRCIGTALKNNKVARRFTRLEEKLRAGGRS